MTLRSEVASAWSHTLTRELERPVRVRFGRARRNVVVVHTKGERTDVRLNEHFADAPKEVKQALGAWLRAGKRARRACMVLDAWIDELGARLDPPRSRRVRIAPHGHAHDLAEIARDVVETDLAGEIDPALAARVTWGRRGTRPPRRSLQLGSFDPETEVVRVHPVLDQPLVPRFFVRYVVFHELLHALFDRGPGKAHHPPGFRRREGAYADYARALAWQEKHLARLFRSARSGKPIQRGVLSITQGWLFPDA